MKGRPLVYWVVPIGALALGAAAFHAVSTPILIAPGTAVHFDDWFFSATKAERVDHVGNVHARRGEAFYLIDLQVRSEAKRVSFTFRPETVRVTIDGRELRPSEDAQRELPSTPFDIGAGETATYRLAMVGPAEGKEVRVKFEAGGVGEWLDAFLGENKEVQFWPK